MQTQLTRCHSPRLFFGHFVVVSSLVVAMKQHIKCLFFFSVLDDEGS